ncbi:MAG: hypothetical protein R3C68_07645 [Myxococcota bacterium]
MLSSREGHDEDPFNDHTWAQDSSNVSTDAKKPINHHKYQMVTSLQYLPYIICALGFIPRLVHGAQQTQNVATPEITTSVDEIPLDHGEDPNLQPEISVWDTPTPEIPKAQLPHVLERGFSLLELGLHGPAIMAFRTALSLDAKNIAAYEACAALARALRMHSAVHSIPPNLSNSTSRRVTSVPPTNVSPVARHRSRASRTPSTRQPLKRDTDTVKLPTPITTRSRSLLGIVALLGIALVL